MRTGFNHIYVFNKDGSLDRQLTDGDWMVAKTGRLGGGVRAVDESGGTVWFTGWREDSTEKHLYRVSLQGGEIELGHSLALVGGPPIPHCRLGEVLSNTRTL